MRPSLIFITETWLHPGIPDGCYKIPGYSIYRSDSVTTPGHAGVCTYILADILKSYNVTEFSFNTPGLDNIFIDIQSKDISLSVGCIYRPRASIYDQLIFDYLENMSLNKKNVIITGDFNFGDIREWPPKNLPSHGSPAFRFVEMLNKSNFNQVVNEATRFRINQTPTTPDLILVDDIELLSDVQYLPPVGKSDHLVLSTKIQFHTCERAAVQERKMKLTDYEEVKQILSEIDWSTILDGTDVDVMWNKFHRIVLDIVSRCTTEKVIRSNPKKPWIDGRILGMIRLKKRLWQRYRRSHATHDFINHRQYSNYLSSTIREAKKSFEGKLTQAKNRKTFYRYVRSQLNSTVSTPTLRENDTLLTDHERIAEIFAETFSGNFSSEPNTPLPRVRAPRNGHSLSEIKVDEGIVEGHLLGLDANKSPGLDDVTSTFLKLCAPFVSSPLTKIYKLSLSTGTLPESWSYSSVTPIFKKGDKHCPRNYRPISLTSAVLKVLERVISSELLEFLLTSSVIPKEQHGFIPGRSILTNLLTCVDTWTIELDRKNPVDVIYLDFSSAFDRVPIRRLLHKMEHFGVRGRLLGWMETFLCGRSFSVKVGAARSSFRPASSGVPQGSVLGPLLFLLYVSELPSLISSTSACYADDMKFFNNPFEFSSVLQNDCDAILRWTEEWMLPLNLAKCRVLHLGRNNPRMKYYLDGYPIESCDSHNDLGVVVDSNLTWSSHILHCTTKAKKSLYMVQRCFNRCSCQTLSSLYKTYIRPILEFAGPVWHPTFRQDELLLEQVQRRATRIPFGNVRPSYEERLSMMKLDKFTDRKLRGDMITAFRAVRGFFGVDLSSLFTFNRNQLRGHHYKLRREQFFIRGREYFLTNRVFLLWNGLPSGIVNASSVNVFKNRWDAWRRE